MITIERPEPKIDDGQTDDDLVHGVFYDDWPHAWCGADVTNDEETDREVDCHECLTAIAERVL